MPLHQALTRYADQIRTILPRHEQGGGFAAQGYARSTGKPGVCMATSGPGATNLVTAIADAKLDSIPLIAITGQVATPVIGTDAFQETPIVEVCRGITKHHYLVTDVNDITRVVREAFHIATTGRPGPVLIDLPKDVQLTQLHADWDVPMNLPGYDGRRKEPNARADPTGGGGHQAGQASGDLFRRRHRGGQCQRGTARARPQDRHSGRDDAHGPGCLPQRRSAVARHAGHARQRVCQSCRAGLRSAAGPRRAVRRSRDRQGVGIRQARQDRAHRHRSLGAEQEQAGPHSDRGRREVRLARLEQSGRLDAPGDRGLGRSVSAVEGGVPFKYNQQFDGILQQHAIATLCEKTRDRKTIITVGVGQHQMWAAQFYKFRQPRTWLSSSGLGTMGFGLPAAMGAQVAHPEPLVVDIDGDGSFQMNIQELATCYCEKLPVKVLLLNNQHLGMVVQWEDRFMAGNRAHTYLGPIDHPEASGNGQGAYAAERYPDFVTIAKGYGCGAATVSKKSDLGDALDDMIDYPGPFVLDVQVPYQEHVLPMIPAGHGVDDMIME